MFRVLSNTFLFPGHSKNITFPNHRLCYSNLATNKRLPFRTAGSVVGTSPEPVPDNGNGMFSFVKLMRLLGSRLEFKVQPSFHEGVNVTVNWRLEWSTTFFPRNKGLSFYVSQLYLGKLVIRNVGLFKEPFRCVDSWRSELLRIKAESGKKLAGAIIFVLIMTIFIKPGLY